MLENKQHIVLPVTMMVEGVHSGSRGAIYHSIQELGRIPQAWDGRPIVIQHPKKDGEYISANSPDIMDSIAHIGKVFNTHVVDSKLIAEAWLSEEKLQTNAPDILEAILNDVKVEVSIGAFTDNEPVENGNWNGETYTHIAHNHRPDHLALLPGERGACSVDDGCGLGVNKENNSLIINKEEVPIMEENGKKSCGQCMEKVIAIINNNAAGFTKDDREWLLTQDETVLDKIMSKQPVQVNAAGDMMKKSDCEKMVANTEPKPITSEQILAAMSAEDRAALAYGKKQLAEKRANLIQGIQANTSKELWPDAELNGMNETMLEKLFKSVKKEEIPAPVDYSLNTNGFRPHLNNKTKVEPLGITGIEFED